MGAVQLVTIKVDNRLRIPEAVLPVGVSETLRAEFEHSNPTFFKQKSMGFFSREPKVITTWKISKDGVLSLPRGGTGAVRRVFERYGLEPDWEDCRFEGEPVRHPEHKCTLWDHQEGVVTAALERENCLVRAPTGSGKTTAAINFLVRAGLPTLIVVWSSNLFDQWLDRLSKELGISKSSIGQIRGSKRTIAPITMAMQQTLYAQPKFTMSIRNKFGCVMADEVQRFAARTFLDVVDLFPARYRVGWSADETRKDKKEFLIYDLFGEVAADINQDVLIEKRLVHDVTVRVVPTDFTADWYVKQMASDQETPDFGKLLDTMAVNAPRNRLITALARTELALGHSVLALTHRREHANGIAREEITVGNRCGVLLGGTDNSHEFKQTVEEMRARTLRFSAGTYQAIGQGLDMPVVDRGICATPIASNKQFFGQVRGRLCRTAPGKQDAQLFYLWDHHVFGIEPIMNLKRWNNRVLVQWEGEWHEASDFVDRWNRGRRFR